MTTHYPQKGNEYNELLDLQDRVAHLVGLTATNVPTIIKPTDPAPDKMPLERRDPAAYRECVRQSMTFSIFD